MNHKVVRELTKSILSALEARGLISGRKAATAEVTALAEELGSLFDKSGRIRCEEAAELCKDYPGSAPESGWCQFSYDYLRSMNFPQIAPPANMDRFEQGARRFLTILQVLLDYERKIRPFDPAFDFKFLPPEIYEQLKRFQQCNLQFY